MIDLDRRQADTLVWAGLAIVLAGFDGSVLVLSLPAIAADFGAKVSALANLGSVLAFGSLGALPLATLADHFGRRRLIAIAVAGFSIANFASAFASSLLALAALRLVAVCFEALVGSVATALIIEEAPPARRGQAVSALAIISGAGLLISTVGYPLVAPHWRWLYLAGLVGLPAAPLIWFRLPEGRVWERAHVSASALRLLLQPPWRLRIGILAATTLVVALVLEPAGLLFTFFASSTLKMSPPAISVLIIASGFVAFPSYVVGGYLSDRLGRRVPGVLLTAAYTLSAGFSFVTGFAGFVAGNILWSAAASGATPVMGAWGGELYPTRARATAEATSGVAGAIGGIAGLQLVGLLAGRLGLGGAIAVAGIAGALGAAFLVALPETRGRPLPD
ncbi:MAG TPA: MFS transporter [Candidatus Dormibacteraeota bacterium]|nr:MFS transporter [Candidatus Dormibacteraeota bacterium]